MKKFIALALIIISLGVSSTVVAVAQQPDVPVPVSIDPTMPPSMIDDVQVPYEIVNYAQLKYQGSAITQASKVWSGGKEVYRLRVAHDALVTDPNDMYLTYDMKWKLITEDKVPVVRPVKVEIKDPEPEEKKPEPVVQLVQPTQTVEEKKEESKPTTVQTTTTNSSGTSPQSSDTTQQNQPAPTQNKNDN